MNWIIVIIAGMFEVAFTFCLGKARASTGMTAYWWYAGFVVALIVSMTLMLKAIQTLPLGTAYAVWTGIGAVGTVLIGILFFNDPTTFWRVFFIVTLIGSIIGLKIVSPH
jgi:quaternary ammonium compound-resistance protein SugE